MCYDADIVKHNEYCRELLYPECKAAWIWSDAGTGAALDRDMSTQKCVACQCLWKC